MRTRTWALIVATTLALTSGLAAGSQQDTTPVTAADIAQLETMTNGIATQATAVKTSNPVLAADVGQRLGDLRDQVTYLKVKLGKSGVTRAEFTDVRDALDSLRVRASGATVRAQPYFEPPDGHVVTVPAGTMVDIRLPVPLGSATSKVDDHFDAMTLVDVKVGGLVAIPAGTHVQGFVSSVRAAGLVADQPGSLTLSFDTLAHGDAHPKLRASVVQAMDGHATSNDDARRDLGSTGSAIPPGMLGSGSGALVGVLVTGGAMTSSEGADVNVPAGAILRLRLDLPVSVTIGGE